MITNHLVTYSESVGYIIDDVNGYIPACKYTHEKGEILIVVPKALEFSMVEKKVVWWVEEYVWNPISNQWVYSKSGKFNVNNEFSVMVVNDNTLLDSITGDYTDASNPNAIGEATYYINTLGKQAIFPAIYKAIGRKLSQ